MRKPVIMFRRARSRFLPKPLDLMLVMSTFSVIYLVLIKTHETLIGKTQTNITDDTSISIEEDNNTVKYYPDHKANDYPVSTLPDPYIISNKDVCKNNAKLKFIVIVTSASLNFAQRNDIRETWGNVSNYNKGEVRIVFILGRPQLEKDQSTIAKESTTYKDIVQGRFLDTYKNLTQKSVLGVRWVKEHCLNSKMVVKVDDDVVINLFELLKMIEFGDCCKNPTEIMCHRRPMGDSPIFRSDDDEKWKIDKEYFPNQTTYPFPYCNGLFAVIAQGAIPILYQISTHMPYFWIEDVYLTGIVASRSKQVILTHVEGIWDYSDDGIYCFKTFKHECVLIAGLSSSPETLRQMWSLLLKYY